jgi:hypothetical protein
MKTAMNVSKDVLALKIDIIVDKNRDECLKGRFREKSYKIPSMM